MWRWALALTVLAGGGALAAWNFIPREDAAPVVDDSPQVAAEEIDVLPEPAVYVPEVKGRKVGLDAFHAEAAQMFAQTPGFGMERMPRFIRKAEEHVIFLSPGDLEKESVYSSEPALKQANASFAKFFGASPKPGEPRIFMFDGSVRGYLTLPFYQDAATAPKQQPEQKASQPELKGNAAKVNATWAVAKIDLVGLIERDNPVVYDSHKILMTPRLDPATGQALKDDGKKFEHGPSGKLLPKHARVPDFFELTGIERLQKGDEVFVRHNENTSIRMLGALRATTDCLRCHEDFKQGDLLGALSYTLRKIN